MLRPLVITTLLVAGICGVAHADVYRWVDEHGEAHYSDRWVPGSELIKSSKSRAFTPESNAAAPSAANGSAPPPKQSAAAKRQQEATEQAVKQDVAKVQ